MDTQRKAYDSDVSDAEWEFVALYLTLLTEDAGRRRHDLREVLNGPSAAVIDSRTVQSTPESGARAGYDGYKRRKGSKVHMAVDTLGRLLALHVTPADEQDRAQAATLCEASGESVELVYADRGYTGEEAFDEAAGRGVILHVLKLPEAKMGFVLLTRRWVVGCSFAWMARFRRLARYYERLASTLEGLHYVAFSILMLHNAAPILAALNTYHPLSRVVIRPEGARLAVDVHPIRVHRRHLDDRWADRFRRRRLVYEDLRPWSHATACRLY